MVLLISDIRIKIPDTLDSSVSTRLFQQMLKNYYAEDQSGADFEIIVSDLPKKAKIIGPLETFRDTLFYEDHKIAYFKTAQMISQIEWSKRCMHVWFEGQDLHDRLFLEQIKHLLSFLVIRKGGIPCHCSAVAHELWGGMIFTGCSGAGKSTAAEMLSRSCRVFNDECNVIIQNGNDWYVYATPFTNPFTFPTSSSHSAPLRKIFSLKQSHENRISPLSFNRKFTVLLESAYTFPTKINTDILMKNIEYLITTVPVVSLHFSISETFEKMVLSPEA